MNFTYILTGNKTRTLYNQGGGVRFQYKPQIRIFKRFPNFIFPYTVSAFPNSVGPIPNSGIAFPNSVSPIPNSGIVFPNPVSPIPNSGIAFPNPVSPIPNSGIAFPNTVAVFWYSGKAFFYSFFNFLLFLNQ